MTNKDKYKQAFSALHVSEGFTLEVTKMEHKKSHKNIKIAVIVLAAVLVLSVGAFAVGQNRIIRSRNVPVDTFDTAEAFNDTAIELSGATAPKQFANGFTFTPGSIQTTVIAEHEDGAETSFELFSARYARGSSVVALNLRANEGQSVNPEYKPTTMGSTTVYVYDGAKIAATEGEDPLRDPRDYLMRSVVWFDDASMYQLLCLDQGAEVSELLDMAMELIGK